MKKNKHPPNDLKVITTCPKAIYKEPRVLHNRDVSFMELKKRIANVLEQSFEVTVDRQYITNSHPFIIVGAEAIAQVLKVVHLKMCESVCPVVS